MRDIHFKHSLRASLLVLVRGKFSSRDGSSAAKISPELAQGELAGTFTEKNARIKFKLEQTVERSSTVNYYK